MGVSVGFHIFIVVIVSILALIFHLKTLRDLMMQGGSLEMAPPPPDQIIEVEIKDILPPPPPVKQIEFIRQLVKPPPTPIEKPKPKPKPQPVAAPSPVKSDMVSHLVVGSSGLPHPGYPARAKLMRITGTVLMSVTFDSSGAVSDAEVVTSSGSSMLDLPTRSFIREQWHNESFAGRTETVPIEYVLDGSQ